MTRIPDRNDEGVATVLAEVEVDPERNRAGESDELDRRICQFVSDRLSTYRQLMQPLYRRWRLTNYMLAGNTIDQAGPMEVHVPELYKQLETLVPRLEEAVLDRDPWFRVRPRKEMDRHTAETIAAFMDWQLAQAGFKSLVQGLLRDLLVTQVAVLKIGWDRRFEKRKRRVRKKVRNGLKVETDYDVTERQECVFDGPTLDPVDPFDLIIDLKCTDPQKARYIGDVAWYTFEELKDFERMGFIKNVDKLKEVNSRESKFDRTADSYKWSRSPIDKHNADNVRKEQIQGDQKLYEVCTLYTKYQLDGEDGEFEECILTVANGTVTLGAMPNYFDYKMRPYATARATRNAHEFFGIGILDNAVRLNQHLDRTHAIGIRTFDIGGMPLVFTEPGIDAVDTLYKVKPGSVLPYGRVTMTTVPEGVLRNLPMMMGLISRNIEETVGVFKANMGQEASADTLGQSMIAQQEGNRRSRGLVRNFTELLNQMLSVIFKENVQFVTEDTTFPVLGKRAKQLRQTIGTISPHSFLQDVDFEFVGLESLHTYGLRATMRQQIVATYMPIIAQNGNRVNQLELLHGAIADTMGPDDADRIVKMPDSPDNRMTQVEENLLILDGQNVEVSPDDPHREHMLDLQPLLARLRRDPESEASALAAAELHYNWHAVAMKRELEQRAVANRERQDAMGPMPPQAPEAGGMPSADGWRRAPIEGGLAASLMPQGQNPGPPDAAKAGKAGRETSPLSQTQNQ